MKASISFQTGVESRVYVGRRKDQCDDQLELCTDEKMESPVGESDLHRDTAISCQTVARKVFVLMPLRHRETNVVNQDRLKVGLGPLF